MIVCIDCLFQLFLRKIRPGGIGEIKLRIGQLPHQEVGETLLSAGADQKIRIRNSCRIQRIRNGLLRDILRSKLSPLYLTCKLLHRAAHLVPRAVIDGNLKSDSGIVLCGLLQMRNALLQILVQSGLVPDHADPYIVLRALGK